MWIEKELTKLLRIKYLCAGVQRTCRSLLIFFECKQAFYQFGLEGLLMRTSEVVMTVNIVKSYEIATK